MFPVFELVNSKRLARATASVVDGHKLFVRKGSTASLWETSNTNTAVNPRRTRQEGLIVDGKLKLSACGTHFIFSEDVLFSTPTAAADVVNGRTSSGPTDWRIIGSTVTFREWLKQEEATE
ncbi:MAG: DUF4357 domain-containing protein [Epibacterium sp.]|nr:DUF4357 domain-containing protein [Epibacterium sp.]NQX73165.1 DUF4357 domain-containing protein [Epibacterium sp.]